MQTGPLNAAELERRTALAADARHSSMIIAATQGGLRNAFDWLQLLRGRAVRRDTPDRRLLEDQILPACARRPDIRRVLFVGCAPYTRHYEAAFTHAEYWTIDPHAHRRWGAHRHVEDRLEHLGRHIAAGYFDLIVCNGVLGWGLDRRADAEAAFAACHTALRAGGELVIGWNDVRPRNGIRPDTLQALARFELSGLPEIGGPRIQVEGPRRHVFEFYRKPGPLVDSASAQEVSVVGSG
jgi:SAM-dependent methyltransferase